MFSNPVLHNILKGHERPTVYFIYMLPIFFTMAWVYLICTPLPHKEAANSHSNTVGFRSIVSLV